MLRRSLGPRYSVWSWFPFFSLMFRRLGHGHSLEGSSVVGKFHRADLVAVVVEQRLRIAVVTANQIALELEVHAICHDLEDAGQLASAVIAVERRVIRVDRYDELHWRPIQVSGASLPLVESHTGTVSAAVHTIRKSSRTDFNSSTQTSHASHSIGESASSAVVSVSWVGSPASTPAPVMLSSPWSRAVVAHLMRIPQCRTRSSTATLAFAWGNSANLTLQHAGSAVAASGIIGATLGRPGR